MSQPTDQKPFKLPKTQAEFEAAVGIALDRVLRSPASAAVFAHHLLTASAGAIRTQFEQAKRQSVTPAVVKIEYPGSFKATVSGERNELTVSYESRDQQTGDWVEVTEMNDEFKAGVTRLVLSQTAVPGDIFYITTPAAIDLAREQVVDSLTSDAISERDKSVDAVAGAVADAVN